MIREKHMGRGRTHDSQTQMDRAIVKSLLERPVAFHRILAQICGSVTAGLMLSQALYWTKVIIETNPERDGWFFKTQEEWQSEVCLSRWEQEAARRALRQTTFWQEQRKDVPAKLWFRVDLQKLAAVIRGHSQNVE